MLSSFVSKDFVQDKIKQSDVNQGSANNRNLTVSFGLACISDRLNQITYGLNNFRRGVPCSIDYALTLIIWFWLKDSTASW